MKPPMTNPTNPVETRFVAPGSLLPPRRIGRMVRLTLGSVLVFWFLTMLMQGHQLLTMASPPGHWSFWAFVIIVYYLTPYVINIGFRRNWRRRSQVAVAIVAALLIGIDIVRYGSWWGPPLGALLWVWPLYISAHLGFSFLLSAVIRTPGCEMRSIPHLIGMLTGDRALEHYCPGPLDRIDTWESQRTRGDAVG